MRKKRHRPAYRKIEDGIERKGHAQCLLAYGAAAIALHRHEGLEKPAIVQLFDVTREIWNACAADKTKSMIMMCEEETGVEVQNGSGKSWHDLPYLNGKSASMVFTPATLAYMRIQQIEWTAASVIACILMALYRKYDFDADMCARFYMQVQGIQLEHGMNPERVAAAAERETGVCIDAAIKREEAASV